MVGHQQIPFLDKGKYARRNMSMIRLMIVFLDVVKAYDYIDRYAIRKKGVEKNIMRMLKAMNDGRHNYVKTKWGKSE